MRRHFTINVVKKPIINYYPSYYTQKAKSKWLAFFIQRKFQFFDHPKQISMRLLKSTIHPDIIDMSAKSFTRKATRAIVLSGDNILLLYTKRYHDYSLPGGGIDEGESNIDGLIRELKEETGAHNVKNIQEFGVYEEFRPWHKSDFDIVHMESYCYICTIDDVLLEPEFESHEIDNGMHPIWMNIHQAISHNEHTIAVSEKKGLSIERETFLLKLIVEELLSKCVEV